MFWIRTRPIFYPFLRLVLLCSPLAKSKSKETKSQTNLRFIDHWKYVLTCFVVIFSDKCDLERNLFTPSSPLIYSASASPLSYCLRLHKCLHMQNTNNMMNKQIKSPGDVFWQIRSWNLFTPGWPLLLFWTLCWPLLIICSAPACPPHPESGDFAVLNKFIFSFSSLQQLDTSESPIIFTCILRIELFQISSYHRTNAMGTAIVYWRAPKYCLCLSPLLTCSHNPPFHFKATSSALNSIY